MKIITCWGLAGVLFSTVAAGQRLDPRGVEDFEKNIRPLLVEHCVKCHGGEEDDIRANLRLDSRAGWMRGGDSGPAIVPGKPDQSLLIKVVRYDGDIQMPPDGKLSTAQIRLLERWVERGAIDPRVETASSKAKQPRDMVKAIEEGRSFWSFRPLSNPEPPMVENKSWPQSPIDHFILARLEKASIEPAAPAEKRILLRRATLDLTGLPPTPEETAAFLADDSPSALAKVIDRLLASPRYGERWGRHWLDVARYSDSNGLDENIAHGNAWRYRDYVVAAFNRDKPFDQFVLEQLAGDLLEPSGEAKNSPQSSARYERLIATGFLSLGPKVLAEVDEKKMEMDIVDEQVDTVGRALLGLTLGCARCHDHKFDPLPTADYYALAGIFTSTKTMESFTKIARWHENSIPTAAELAAKAEHDARVAERKASLASFIEKANGDLRKQLGAGAAFPPKPEKHYPDKTKKELKRLRDELAKLEKAAPEVSSAMGVVEGRPLDLPVHIRGSHLNLGSKVQRGFPQVLMSESERRDVADDGSGRLQLARWLTRKDHPLTARVFVNRLWRWRFGRGLVASTDNFGALGERPTHPALLDYLASRFVQDGWSIKHMHRRMMFSRVYASSGGHDEQADPENRLYGRWSPRRLEAEAIRDSLLAVSGRLDLSMGGSMLHVKNREFFFDHTSKDTTKYDSRRRSLYLPVVRNHVYDFFQLFDFPDPAVPNGDRTITTVAPQALFMMNSDLAGEVSEGFAERLLMTTLTDSQRVERMYQLAYSRPPREEEVSRALAFLSQIEDRRQAWQALCQVILSSNEFVSY